MKNNIITIIFITQLLVCFSSQSATLIVDGNLGHDTSATHMYSTLQAAHDAASSGDTIYVRGAADYPILTVSKQLHFVGPGYFLAENLDTRADNTHAQINGLTCNPGSSGSSFTGLYFKGQATIEDSNITLKRCRFFADSTDNIQILKNSPNTIITQNYILSDWSDNSAHGISINTPGNSSFEISNNYIQMDDRQFDAIVTSVATVIKNNVFFGKLTVSNSTIKNNIARDIGGLSGDNNGIINNIANSTQFGTTNGNQSNVSMSSVFVGSGTTDGQWQLKASSPAINAGDDFLDIGMFGGSNPYVLSGIAPLPTIYSFRSSSTATNSSDLRFNMKIKARE